MPSSHSAAAAVRDDVELVQRIGRSATTRAFETLMRQPQRAGSSVVARAILRDDAAAEDAVQDGYLDGLPPSRSRSAPTRSSAPGSSASSPTTH